MAVTEVEALDAVNALDLDIDGWAKGGYEAGPSASGGPVLWVFKWFDSDGGLLASATVDKDGNAEKVE